MTPTEREDLYKKVQKIQKDALALAAKAEGLKNTVATIQECENENL